MSNSPSVIWYFRSRQIHEPPYEEKHKGLLDLIDRAMNSNHITTIAISEQRALGDNETEFHESLRRIAEAELNLLVSGVQFHPRELHLIQWRE